MGWSKTMIEKQRVPGSSPAWKRKDFFQPCCDPQLKGKLKGKCIDFSSRAQMKDNWISVPMVYLSLAYGKGNLPYRRFPDPVSMATTGDDAHSA